MTPHPSQFHLSGTERRVLDAVRRAGNVNRFKIAQQCDLLASTMTRVAGDLLEKGLICEEVAPSNGQRGKPRLLLRLNPQGAHSIGLALTAESLSVCLANQLGEKLAESVEPLSSLAPGAVADRAADAIAHVLGKSGISPELVVGVGLSMPGNSTALPPYIFPLPQFAGWDSVVPAEFMAQRLGLPVWFQNDAQAVAVAEATFGQARAVDNFVSFYMAHGFGAGIFVDGRLLRGAHGNAGLLGALAPRPLTRPSGEDLIKHLALAGFAYARLDQIIVTEQNRAAIDAWIARAATQIADISRVLAAVVDPELIFLSGLIPQCVIDALVEKLAAWPISTGAQMPQVIVRSSRIMAAGPQLAAAALPLRHILFGSP